MSIVISYLIAPLVLLLIVVNVYLRLKIIGTYKSLRQKDIMVEELSFFNHKQRKQVIESKYPEYKDELTAFSASLRNLIYIVVAGFVIILVGFLFIYFNK